MGKPANNLQLEVLKYLRAKGIMVWKNQFQTYNHKLGIHISDPYSPIGSADLLAVLPPYGQLVGLEIKAGKDKIRPDQVLWGKRITALGGQYIVVKSLDDVKGLI